MITSTYYNKLKSHKKIFAILFCFLFFTYTILSAPYFSGTMGIGGQLLPVPDEFPALLLDSYFAGQFDISEYLMLRTGLSMYNTDSILKEGIFQNVPSIFNLDEVSLTYRGSVGELSHFLGIYLGEYDPVGSDIFLQRQFGIPSFASRLTESICGISRAKIYDMAGIGGSYVIKFPQNVSLGVNLYYNKAKKLSFSTDSELLENQYQSETEDFIEEDPFIESLNTDLRFAGAWSAAALDLSIGFTMPMEKEVTSNEGDTQKVILLIKRADMHAGLTAYFGSSNSSSLLFQAGFTKLLIDPNEEEKILSFDDVYILIEPRFVAENLCFSLSLFNMPLSTKENLFYINDPVGASVSIYTPWISVYGKKSQFGLMTTMSLNKTLDNIIKDNETAEGNTDLREKLGLFISPYGIIHLGSGKLNFSLNVNALDIKDWNSFLSNISLIAGYKVLL